MMTHDELLHGLAQKDLQALDAFYLQYKSHILAIARRIVNDEWDAEEVLQDVVWIAYRKADTLRENTNLRAWVSQVTRNAALMLLRKRRRVPTPMDTQLVDLATFQENRADEFIRPDAVVMQRRNLQIVSEKLDTLDPVNKALFVAMDVNGKTKEEVADEFGLSTAAVKSRLHRVRQSVRSLSAELSA